MTDQICGWVKLYTPQGVQVTVPLPVDGTALDDVQAQALLTSVNSLLAAGFLVDAPGLDAGEQKDMVGWVVRRNKKESDGSKTPILDLYVDQERMKHPRLSMYLNTDDDKAKFERASGLRLNDIPVYVGTGRLTRGDDDTDHMVVRAPRPFGVVYVNNPDYDPNETDPNKKVPARKFVRWADTAPAIPTGDGVRLLQGGGQQKRIDGDRKPPADSEDPYMDTDGVNVKLVDKRPRLYFERDGVTVVAFTREALRAAGIDAGTLDQLAFPGTYQLPPVRVFYKSVFNDDTGDLKYREVVRIQEVVTFERI